MPGGGGLNVFQVGAESILAFGLESAWGWNNAVKAQMYLNATAHTFGAEAATIESAALRRDRGRPLILVPGRAGGGGTATFEVTSEVWDRILPAFLNKESTGGSSPYTHYWQPAERSEFKSLTMVAQKGDNYYVYPGCIGDSLELSCDVNGVVMGRATFVGETEWQYNNAAAKATPGGDGTTDGDTLIATSAAFDSNPPMPFVQGEVKIGALHYDTVAMFTFRILNNAVPIYGITRQRRPIGINVGDCRAEIELTLPFDSNDELGRFLWTNTLTYPYVAGTTVRNATLDIWCTGDSETTAQHVTPSVNVGEWMRIRIPQIRWEAADVPVDGPGIINLRLRGVAVYDSTLGTIFEIQVTNTEASTSFTTVGTAINASNKPSKA